MTHDHYAYLDEMGHAADAPKFSVGQRVRVTEDDASSAEVRAGDEGVVTTVAHDGYLVEMDTQRHDCGRVWSFSDDDLEAVDEPTGGQEIANDYLSGLLTARGSRYGSFEDNSEISQALKETIHAGYAWGGMSSDSREALDQFACKISRIVTGDPDYADNWDDIAGYAKLVADRLRRDAAGVPEGAR